MTEQTGIIPVKAEVEIARANRDAPEAIAQSTELAMIKQKAGILVESGLLPEAIDSWQKAASVMLKAREMNIPDLVALQHISIVKGSWQIDAQLTLALLERSGLMENFRVMVSTNDICTIRVKRLGRSPMDYTCTLEEAAGLRSYEKGNWIPLTETSQWKAQRKNKLFYFTVKQMARHLFADVLNGMAGKQDTPLTMPDVDYEDAEFAEVEETPPPAVTVPLSVSPSAPEETPNEESGSGEAEVAEEVHSDIQPPPTIGTLDMVSLLNRATRENLVNHPNHFNNLVRKMKDSGEIRDAMSADNVLDPMRAHKAAKELES